MKVSILLFLMILAFKFSIGTIRILPDQLIYKGDTLNIYYSSRPTILQSLYQQKKLEYNLPEGYHTSNDPTATAMWEIKNNKLILITILVNGNSHNPSEFGIDSISQSNSLNQTIFAEWFTGIICSRPYFFKIEDGQLVNSQILNEKDDNLEKYGVGYLVMNTTLEKKEILIEYCNYINFYYYLHDDVVIFRDTMLDLGVKENIYNPIFSYNGLDYRSWPYGWRNTTISGAPQCKWLIENDSLFLSELVLTQSVILGKSYVEIKLDSMFDNLIENNKVFASWVNGVYSIYTTCNTQPKSFLKKKIDIETHYYIKIQNGVLVQIAKQSTYIYNDKWYTHLEDVNLDTDYLKLRKEYNSL